MISTVTTTVSTIVSSTTVVGLLSSLGIAAVVTLIVSLATRELVSYGVVRFKLFGQNLGIIVLPLLFVFIFIFSIAFLGLIAA